VKDERTIQTRFCTDIVKPGLCWMLSEESIEVQPGLFKQEARNFTYKEAEGHWGKTIDMQMNGDSR
jgi:hypothetical protein